MLEDLLRRGSLNGMANYHIRANNLQGSTLGEEEENRRRKWTDNAIGWIKRLFTEINALACIQDVEGVGQVFSCTVPLRPHPFRCPGVNGFILIICHVLLMFHIIQTLEPKIFSKSVPSPKKP